MIIKTILESKQLTETNAKAYRQMLLNLIKFTTNNDALKSFLDNTPESKVQIHHLDGEYGVDPTKLNGKNYGKPINNGIGNIAILSTSAHVAFNNRVRNLKQKNPEFNEEEMKEKRTDIFREIQSAYEGSVFQLSDCLPKEVAEIIEDEIENL